MTIGADLNKAALDAAVAQIARQQFGVIESVDQLKLKLDTIIDADLTGMGYSSGEVAQLKSGVSDLANLGKVFRGEASGIALPYDHRTFSKLFLGTGLY